MHPRAKRRLAIAVDVGYLTACGLTSIYGAYVVSRLTGQNQGLGVIALLVGVLAVSITATQDLVKKL
jgi:hypothetical protein